MDIYQQNRHNRCISWSVWHLEWCTKYRYKVFYSVVYRELCRIFVYEATKKHNFTIITSQLLLHNYYFTIIDCEVEIDHVHVVASLPLTMTPANALQDLKGMSSKGLFIQIPHLKRLYRRGHLWSPGKFVGSIGHITLDKAKKYLEAHHAKTPTGIPSPNSSSESSEARAFRHGRTSNCSFSFILLVGFFIANDSINCKVGLRN